MLECIAMGLGAREFQAKFSSSLVIVYLLDNVIW
jgi:hypothetical protein